MSKILLHQSNTAVMDQFQNTDNEFELGHEFDIDLEEVADPTSADASYRFLNAPGEIQRLQNTDNEFELGDEFNIVIEEVAHPRSVDASLKVLNAPGEIQRLHLVQYGTKRTIHGNMVNVVHGHANGRLATLIVLQFDFLGSSDGKRRFRDASIELRFAHEEEQCGGDHDPEVLHICPEGEYKLENGSTVSIESTISGGVSASFAPVGLEGVGINAGVEQTVSKECQYHAKVFGSRRIEKRRYGDYNAVRWALEEDRIAESGIPSSLRAAVLVVQKTAGIFRAELEVQAQVDLWYSLQRRIQHLRGTSTVDPVFFDRKQPWFGPKIEGLDIDNLSTTDLQQLSFIKVSLVCFEFLGT